MKAIRRLGRRGAVAVVLMGIWFVALRPQSLGGPATYLLIRGDSMEPTFHTGDLAVVLSAKGYAIGDVVAYRVPAGEIGGGHIVVHRIAGGDGAAGYLMRGDNNPSVDPWQPQTIDIVGKALVAIPGAGTMLSVLHRPAAAGALAVSLMTVLWLLRRLPRPSPFVPPRTGPAGL